MQQAKYGEWVSPISAESLAASGHPVGAGAWAGDQVWWTELRPDEAGRTAVRTTGAGGEPVDVLPAPWNARTRVHEYGGGATAIGDPHSAAPTLYFCEFSDQRIWALTPHVDAAPRPLTPPGLGMRFAELQVVTLGGRTVVLAVREQHRQPAPDEPEPDTASLVSRDLVAVPIDGSAASDPDAISTVVAGSHFLAGARLSPDGARLAWIAWEHPLMPWDGTELQVGPVDGAGRVTEWRRVAGSLEPDTLNAVLQPEWMSGSELAWIDESTGWWRVVRGRIHDAPAAVEPVPAEPAAVEPPTTEPVTPEPVTPEPVTPDGVETGGPLWNLGSRWYAPLGDGRMLVAPVLDGRQRLQVVGADGSTTTLDAPPVSRLALGDVRDGAVLVAGTGVSTPNGLWSVPLDGSEPTLIRSGADAVPAAEWMPVAEPMTFDGPHGPVHAFFYPPTNPHFAAPEGELPPVVAHVHGGPTSMVNGQWDLPTAYFTSRGIGVIDVNYGGSTGYGRDYRRRLNGQWGVVDVDDTVAAVRGLADAGRADARRLAISGGSAGGWTTLAALVGTDAFACGVDYYGVAELERFVADTHDFESRYTHSLVGPWPDAIDLYRERAPLSQVDALNCPVLILQGLDDPIVPPSQSELLRDALAAKGIPHAYITYAGESHGFRQAATIVDAHEKELSFYGRVLGFTPPGVPPIALAP